MFEKKEFTPDFLVYIYGKADNMILYGNTAYISMIAIISISILNFFSFTGCIKCCSALHLLKHLLNILLHH